jgi:tricorn protease
LPHINNNYDFAELLSELLGELNVSHTGCTFKGRKVEAKSITANLGLIYDLNYKGDGLKVSEVIVGGPFDKAESALKAGDIITAIDGKPILKGEDFFPLLNNKVGKRVLCDIVKPNGVKAQVVAEPITNGACDTLLYWRWVKNNVEKVEKLSGGRLGYVHIWAMKDEYFRKLYSDVVGKYNNYEGVVIDTRFNPGGHLQEVIEILTTGYNYMSRVVRDKFASDMPRSRFNHPSIMIMCEANYSNAHGTPWMYKNRKIGKLVGMPVAGTMTSVNFINMQDKSLRYGIPIVGYRDEQGNYLENQLLLPDVEVDNAKETVVKGVDAQLETAVKELLKDIDGKR